MNEQVIEQKIANKEALTPEETKFVMSYPADGSPAQAADDKDGDDDAFKDIEDDDATDGTKSDDGKPEAGKDKKDGKAEADEAKKKSDKEKADADAKAAEAAAAEKAKKEAEEGIFDKVEKELQKPEGQEDLTGLSEREKGLYYALKSERKKRQKAEEDRDEVLFRDVKARKTAEAKEAADKKAKEEEPDIKFEGQDEDFITVKEAKSIVDAMKKAAANKGPDGSAEEVAAQNRTHALRIAEMSARDVLESRIAGGQKDLPDFDKTMKIGELIVESNPAYQKAIYEAYKTGKNPALITYDLVRKDPKFAALYGTKADATPKAEDDKAKQGKENLKKIDENEKKPKTSGNQGGGNAEGIEGYTLQQLNDMTPSQFRKVPKHIREKFLYNA